MSERLKGKKALIMGVANERSIAWGIAQALAAEGAEIAMTYVQLVEKRVRPLAEQLSAKFVTECDVTNDAHLDALSKKIDQDFNGELDILIHSLAYAEKEDLERGFVHTSREGFAKALDVSAYSLVAATRACFEALKKRQGAVLTLSYYGAERVIPNYNVMGVAKAALEASVRYLAYDGGPFGVRVNAISAGPIRTLAASGVKDFRSMLGQVEEKAPLKRNVTIDEVGQAAAFLSSDAARGVTGQILYVDSGFSIMGM